MAAAVLAAALVAVMAPASSPDPCCGARCLPATGRLVRALLDAPLRCASAARSSRARLGDGITRLATGSGKAAGAVPGLDLQLRPPDLRPPRPAAFLVQDLAAGGTTGPAEHGLGGEVAAGAAGALLGTGAAALLGVAAISAFDLPCCAWGSGSGSADNSDFAALAILTAGVELFVVPLGASLGVKWAGGHPDGNGWRAYGYALGTHALTLLVAGLVNRTAISLPLLAVGDLVFTPLAARAGWHHVSDGPVALSPGGLTIRF